MKITLIIILLFSQFLFADIIGGKVVSEKEHKAALKFFIGKYINDKDQALISAHSMKKPGQCSSIRIAPQYILTAAHCFDGLTKFLTLKEERLDRKVAIESDLPIRFEDQLVKVESYEIHPEYLRRIKLYFLKEKKLEKQFEQNIITKDFLDKEKDRIYFARLKSIMKYDLAVVKTVNSSQHYYEVAFNKVYEKEPVHFVGFGKEMTSHEVNTSIENHGEYRSKALASNDDSEAEELFLKMFDIEKKVEAWDADSPKKIGKNILHNSNWNEMYTTKGQAEQDDEEEDQIENDMGSLGDSGMGLLVNQDGKSKVVGIFSFYSFDEYKDEGADYIFNFFANTSIDENQAFIKKYQ